MLFQVKHLSDTSSVALNIASPNYCQVDVSYHSSTALTYIRTYVRTYVHTYIFTHCLVPPGLCDYIKNCINGCIMCNLVYGT